MEKLCYEVIGCAMRVHSDLGCGFSEIVYSRSLAIEMYEAGLLFAKEEEKEVYYRDTWVGHRKVDFLVGDDLIIEIKATSAFEPVHFVQVKNYLKVSKHRVDC